MNLCLRQKFARPSFVISLFRYSTTTPEVIEQNEQVLIDDADDVQAREAEIEKKRNVSRLTSAHYNIMNDRRPYEEPRTSTHLTVKYNRKLYGKYGIASGVNPSICWPTQMEIKERQEYEAVAFPFTIREMMETAAQKRKEERLIIEQRENEIAAKLVKLTQWKKDLKNKMAKKIAEAEAAKIVVTTLSEGFDPANTDLPVAIRKFEPEVGIPEKAKKERLVEEVRRHFGFKLDPRDERFQEMLAKREKAQKKEERFARKEAKEQMMIAKLQQTNAKITDNK